MMGRIAGLGLLAVLAGCGVPGQTGGPMREAGAAEVAACRYITDITMTPGVYGPLLTERALTLARARVKADAQAAGADTVVFAQPPAGATVYQVEAKAYRCAP
jgi:hypothetical protein